MARSSRERKQRAHRRRAKQQLHQNGELLQDKEYAEPEREYTIKGYALRHRALKIAIIIKKHPQHIALSLASREEAGWLFGRLFIVGLITGDQKLAAERLSYAVSNYRRLLHRYGGLKSANLEGRIDGSVSEDLSPHIEKRLARAVEQYDKVMERLRSCGIEVERAVIQALETDELTDLGLICTGLDSLYHTFFSGRRRTVEVSSESALDTHG